MLVVDDEPHIVALVAYHLAKAGYRVATAGNGTDALARANREPPALVVLDLMLPGMKWALTQGEKQASALDYAPLPASMATRLVARLDSIKVGTTQ